MLSVKTQRCLIPITIANFLSAKVHTVTHCPDPLTAYCIQPFFRTVLQWGSLSEQFLTKQMASGGQEFLLHLALCKLDLGQGQGSMQSDLGSCNFPPSRVHSPVLILAQHPSSLCRASVCPLQATFIEGGRQLGGAGPEAALGVQTSGSNHKHIGIGLKGAEGPGRHVGAVPGLRRWTPASAWCSRCSGAR